MNIFRLLGDLSHLLAIIILLQKIWKTRSCAGISVTIFFIRLHLSLSCHRSWNCALLFVHCNRALNTCNDNEFSLLSTPVTFYPTVLKFIFRYGTISFQLFHSQRQTLSCLSQTSKLGCPQSTLVLVKIPRVLKIRRSRAFQNCIYQILP